MTGEVFFDDDEIIVSKTDLKGRITYANRTFCDVCGYHLDELIGEPHSIIRHDDMPRAVFQLLWDRLAKGDEVFAYVKNATKNGGFYWVFAHVTPTWDIDQNIIGFHSSRRCPDRKLISNVIEPLYAQLRSVEKAQTNRKQGLVNSAKMLSDVIHARRRSYNDFIFSLQGAG